MSAVSPTHPDTRRNLGRPTKFTPDAVERIFRCVERGMPLRLAAEAAGISYQSLSSYRTKHQEFADGLLAAVAKGVEKRLTKIEEASEAGDWRAAAWLLEHCQPEYFSKSRLEVTGADGSALAIGVAIYLPKKDGASMPTIEVKTKPTKEIENG